MTTHTATGRPAPPRLRQPLGIPIRHRSIVRDHTITGTATQLSNLVANHRLAGTLVAMTAPRPVGDRYQVIIWVREYQPTRPTVTVSSVGEHTRTRARRPRRARVAVIATAVAGAVAGILAVAAYLIGQLVELVAAHAGLILGVLALAAILAALAAWGSGRRRHCPGC